MFSYESTIKHINTMQEIRPDYEIDPRILVEARKLINDILDELHPSEAIYLIENIGKKRRQKNVVRISQNISGYEQRLNKLMQKIKEEKQRQISEIKG